MIGRPFFPWAHGVAVPAAALPCHIFAHAPPLRSGHAHELPLADDNRAAVPNFQVDRFGWRGFIDGGVGVGVASTRAAWRVRCREEIGRPVDAICVKWHFGPHYRRERRQQIQVREAAAVRPRGAACMRGRTPPSYRRPLPVTALPWSPVKMMSVLGPSSA